MKNSWVIRGNSCLQRSAGVSPAKKSDIRLLTFCFVSLHHQFLVCRAVVGCDAYDVGAGGQSDLLFNEASDVRFAVSCNHAQYVKNNLFLYNMFFMILSSTLNLTGSIPLGIEEEYDTIPEI